MLYPVLTVIMTPFAAVLLDTFGVAWILIAQGGLSLLAAITESFIRLDETERHHSAPYSLQAWASDIREAVQYLKKERGLLGLYEYMAVSNGVTCGFSPLLIAFFRTFPGFTAAMYAAFSVVEFIGRSIGSAFSLVMGFLGEMLDYRWCITIGGTFTLLAGFVLILVKQKEVRRLYEPEEERSIS